MPNIKNRDDILLMRKVLSEREVDAIRDDIEANGWDHFSDSAVLAHGIAFDRAVKERCFSYVSCYLKFETCDAIKDVSYDLTNPALPRSRRAKLNVTVFLKNGASLYLSFHLHLNEDHYVDGLVDDENDPLDLRVDGNYLQSDGGSFKAAIQQAKGLRFAAEGLNQMLDELPKKSI